jgi:hypothetical protein
MLDKFHILFPAEKNLDNMLNGIVAVTKPKQTFQEIWSGKNQHQHIIFQLNGERAYVDCEEVSKTILRGLDIERV